MINVIETPLSAVVFNILKAYPLKSKHCLKSLSVRLSFINQSTLQPLMKSSQAHSAVSYYEKDNPNIDYLLPVMTQSCKFSIDK